MKRKSKSSGSRKRRNPVLPAIERGVKGSTDGKRNLSAVSALSTRLPRKPLRVRKETNMREQDIQALPNEAKVVATRSGLAKLAVIEGSQPSPLLQAIESAKVSAVTRAERKAARKQRKGLA